MKIALVHDWFVESGGAEKVVASILNIFPDAEVFSTVDYLSPSQRKSILKDKKVHTTFIQRLPFSKKYKKYFSLMPLAMESLDFSDYDVVISSSSSVGKGIITGPDQIHICYCHSPMRYAWDLQEQYLKESGLNRGVKSFFARYLLFFMRNWDVRSSFGVDYYVANSDYISKRIKKVYRRDSEVIYPSVDVDDFESVDEKEDFYFTCSRMVPYKKIDLIVDAFSQMPDKRLVVIGDGPDMKKIKKKAGSNVELLGHQPFTVLKDKMAAARAFVFAAEEDFGIVPVEAQASGTPVIAYRKGGALETIIDGETGIFFDEQNVESIIQAVKEFESKVFDFNKIRKNSERFSAAIFNQKFKHYVIEKVKDSQ
jgi:glycosyltransferase involved in cell wall biosynthesis